MVSRTAAMFVAVSRHDSHGVLEEQRGERAGREAEGLREGARGDLRGGLQGRPGPGLGGAPADPRPHIPARDVHTNIMG